MSVPNKTFRAKFAEILDIASIGIGAVLLVLATYLLVLVTSRGRDALDIAVAIMATMASAGILLRGAIGRHMGAARN